ncbi:MAG: dihydrolipoamide acetyltransferase family protein [Dehalococcoidia bacterium]
MAEVTMPRLSDTMEEGSVQRWLKQPGDTVETGDIIAEIETDKAVMELEAYESGTLQQILVPEGEVVPIGRPIAMIGDGPAAPTTAESAPPTTGAQQVPAEAGAPAEATRATGEARAEAEAPATPAPSTPAPSAPTGNGRAEDGRTLATPVARRMAEEWGIDLGQVRGTGPGGRILRENVEEFRAQAEGAAAHPQVESTAQAQPDSAPTQPAPGAAQPAAPSSRAAAPPSSAAGRAGEVTPLSRMRRAIAVTMSGSKPGTPHFYIDSEVDMGEAMTLRAQINDAGAAEVKISVNDLIVKAVARALRGFPAINSSYATGADGQPGVIRHEQINVSVATALEDGLLAPVVRDADTKSLSTISAEIQDMAGRAREGRIRQNELDGATFQVSNLGMFDVFAFISVITPPQAGSLAIGSVRRVPVVQEDGQLGVGQMMHIVLSADHRVTDGATGARFLQEVKRLLQTPLSLIV